jgi:hypothetical protein
MSRHPDPLSIYSEAVSAAGYHQDCLIFLSCSHYSSKGPLWLHGRLLLVPYLGFSCISTCHYPQAIPMPSPLLPHLDNSPRGQVTLALLNAAIIELN